MKKKNVKYISNNSYTRVFIRPRTVTKVRTLGQLRHRSVAKVYVYLLLRNSLLKAICYFVLLGDLYASQSSSNTSVLQDLSILKGIAYYSKYVLKFYWSISN